MLQSRILTLAASGLLAYCAPLLVYAEQPSSERIERGQLATQRGLAAVRQNEWALAVKYFEQARRDRPATPTSLLNLAMANDRRGGRELQAIAWYRAYLTASPFAQDAEAVKSRIIDLEIQFEARILTVLKTARAAAEELPDSGYATAFDHDVNPRMTKTVSGRPREANLLDVAWLYAELGDSETASHIANRLQHLRVTALARIAGAQLRHGRNAAAERTLNDAVAQLEREPGGQTDRKAKLLERYAAAQIATGDLSAAEQTLEKINMLGRKHAVRTQLAIAAAQLEMAEVELARRRLLAILEAFPPSLPERELATSVYVSTRAVQLLLAANDLEGAKLFVTRCKSLPGFDTKGMQTAIDWEELRRDTKKREKFDIDRATPLIKRLTSQRWEASLRLAALNLDSGRSFISQMGLRDASIAVPDSLRFSTFPLHNDPEKSRRDWLSRCYRAVAQEQIRGDFLGDAWVTAHRIANLRIKSGVFQQTAAAHVKFAHAPRDPSYPAATASIWRNCDPPWRAICVDSAESQDLTLEEFTPTRLEQSIYAWTTTALLETSTEPLVDLPSALERLKTERLLTFETIAHKLNHLAHDMHQTHQHLRRLAHK